MYDNTPKLFPKTRKPKAPKGMVIECKNCGCTLSTPANQWYMLLHMLCPECEHNAQQNWILCGDTERPIHSIKKVIEKQSKIVEAK